DIILNAIQSVFDQSYTNWELIICDDESTDETSKVLGKITSSKLRYFKLKKQGAAAARNYGHSKSKGKYIAYLDSDNLWHPEFLRITIGALENRLGIHCVYTKYIDVERLKDKGKESFKIKSFKGLPFNYEKLAEKNYIDLNTFVHRKGLIDHYGGFNNQLKRQQDWDLILKYTFLRDPIYIDNYLVYYQRNESWNQITKIHKYDNSSLEIIRSNLSLYYKHGLQSKLRVNKEANPTITILSWDVCRNHFSKAYNIAEAICGSYNVQLLGFRFFEEEIFQPYKDETPPFELKIIEGSDFPGFHSAMSEALLNIKGDIVYAVKPRLSSLGLALLANHNFNKKVVLEFNDLETVVANPQKDKLNSAFDVNQLDLNSEELKSPYSLLWSNILEEFGQRMPVTTTHNKNLDRFFGSNSFYLRNLKDESYYDPLKYDRDEIRHSLGYSTSDRIILFGGLLRKHKGIFELIELLDKLNDERYKLLFVGSRETPDQRKLKESFGDKVQILPPQDRNYMAAINYASDLVVLWLDPEIPASHYQMPYKFTDAIAMKVPVIANDISDLGDLARQGYVKEVPHHDYDALVKGIKQIFDHPKKTQEMVEAGRNLYLRQFSYKAIKSNIDMLVDQNFELLNEVSKDFAELYGNFYSKSNNKAD
ncbi:MAG: glycosyltransferase, partial [Fulvivirga sp.]|uniref:glycosyltransferase n=1 Tax=Fulvivirga sp. TaxID=1931237 RepID=UPI0032EB6D6B